MPHLDRQNRVIVDLVRKAIDGVIAVYRFGSTVQGTAMHGSDTDLAVLAREPLPGTRRFDLQEQLAGALGGDVDLVDLRAASPVLAIRIVAHGQLLFDDGGPARGAFEDRTFGAYARLNEERRGILERVAAEGSIYGR